MPQVLAATRPAKPCAALGLSDQAQPWNDEAATLAATIKIRRRRDRPSHRERGTPAGEEDCD